MQLKRLWLSIPAVCAFAALAFQVAIPWTPNYLVTADGPAHVYGAIVARDIVFHHRTSVYTPTYTLQRHLLPNWTTTILLAGIDSIAGSASAERVFLSLAMLLGFLGLAYLSKSLAPERSPWTPLFNFAVQSWFLWVGFYNFYLGMVLLPFLIGYMVRHRDRLDTRRILVLAVGMAALFFTHIIPAVIAAVALACIVAWQGLFHRRFEPRQIGATLIAMLPVVLLALLFARGAPVSGHLLEFARGWRGFPQHIFMTGQGVGGGQFFLRRYVLVYIGIAIAAMTGKEWRSARGALVALMGLCFLAYLFVTDNGLGGSIVKIRFAWVIYLIGVAVAASVSRLRLVTPVVALAVSWFFAQNLISTREESRLVSNAVTPYIRAASHVPGGSTIVRLSYRTPNASALYGYNEDTRFPFRHLDSLVAARNGYVDLTDYEAPTELFPVVFKPGSRNMRYQLWGFEGPGTSAEAELDWIMGQKRVDAVLVFGDIHSPDAMQQGMPGMVAHLEETMHLIAQSSDGFLRVYGRPE